MKTGGGQGVLPRPPGAAGFPCGETAARERPGPWPIRAGQGARPARAAKLRAAAARRAAAASPAFGRTAGPYPCPGRRSGPRAPARRSPGCRPRKDVALNPNSRQNKILPVLKFFARLSFKKADASPAPCKGIAAKTWPLPFPCLSAGFTPPASPGRYPRQGRGHRAA